MLTVMVCGTRGYKINPALVIDRIVALVDECGDFDVHVITGDCPTGADRAAREAVEEANSWGCNWQLTVYAADCGTHGKAAGPLRNQAMVDAGPDVVVAFWDGKSRGTLDAIKRAVSAGAHVEIPRKSSWMGRSALGAEGD